MFGRRRAPNLTRGVVRGRGTSATTSSTASSAYTKKYGGLFIFERERHRILEHMETDAVFDDEEAALEEAEKYTKSEMTTALRDRGIEVTDQLDALSIENVESQKVFDMLAEYKGGAAQAYFDHQEAAIAKLEEERDTAIRQVSINIFGIREYTAIQFMSQILRLDFCVRFRSAWTSCHFIKAETNRMTSSVVSSASAMSSDESSRTWRIMPKPARAHRKSTRKR